MQIYKRRRFLKTALAGTAAACGSAAFASPDPARGERLGVLVDTTVCVGCRHCEWACRVAHNLPGPALSAYTDRTALRKRRRPDPGSLTVINEYENPENKLLPIDVKFQCMHCEQPACVSACIVGAFHQESNGTVLWNSDKCIGCRYCMVACPFQIPTFEFEKALKPNISKCDLCIARTRQGKLPACIDICPVETMIYGPRSELIRIARRRIKRSPDKYIDHIFGEKEVGGTTWMYLAGKDFDTIGFPKLGINPAPGVSEAIQHGIFAYFFPPVALYAMLGGMMWISKRRKEIKEEA